MAARYRASYTPSDDGRKTKRPHCRSAVIAVLASSVMLSGCSTIRPLSAWVSGGDAPPPGEITTGSIPKPTVAQPAPESDGEVVRRTVETAAQASSGARIEWTNPASGHSGTITDLVASRAKNGASCRDFATTLATVEGVSMYRGRACQGYLGPWDLVDFAPAAATPPG